MLYNFRIFVLLALYTRKSILINESELTETSLFRTQLLINPLQENTFINIIL